MAEVIHLHQKSLKLTPRRVNVVKVIARHESANIDHDVAKTSIEDESVDGLLVKSAGHAECSNDEDRTKQRQG